MADCIERTGSAETHRKKRQRVRARLRAQGYSETRIEELLSDLSADQRRSRVAASTGSSSQPEPHAKPSPKPRPVASVMDHDPRAYRARLEEETYARLAPDDRRFRPVTPDPLTTGPARATGITAKAIRRTKAITKHEYDRLVAEGRA